ncbi:PQQ-dependent sugar dehydrogenase [Actinophytocola oryzae]|uniref:Glucose/arabinose dehydrogenase n=1 Tax=Actinophytocola oryzae TaxID=502181 RepID=A0A4V3FUE1_9PSEU|nr:PQQ-dependent sugar dehydrogenase [Actinophytocola oryzae]TDV54891.1 glucose/arabinose dehydrogenase [Actinophytocola oryzae]
MPRHRRRLSGAIAVGALALSLSTPGPAAAVGPVPLDQITVTTTQLVPFGLQRPVALAGLPDGRMLVVEKQGTVRAYHPTTGLAADPVLDIRDRVDISGNERGLLGIVPAPNFTATRLVYIAYTSLPSGTLTLSRIQLGNPASERVLLTQPHAEFSNHNGGQLAFGADGYLYWSLGDGGNAADPFGSGQSLSTLLGKILRIDVNRTCGALPYCVPRDNPFVGVAGARPEIWVYGGRNPWRFSFDKLDGSLWIGDVGQGTREEVDHLRRNQGGANLGWSCREGTTVFNPDRCDPTKTYTDPVFEYQSSVQGCAVIGGMVYRGRQYASLVGGTYVATDYCSNTAWAVRANPNGTYTNGTIGEFPTQVTSFGVDRDGEWYVVNDLPGQMFKVGFTRTARS